MFLKSYYTALKNMKALVLDRKKMSWENSEGFDLVEIASPNLGVGDEKMVIVKVYFAGVCGTDRGIWFRQVFREQILNSLENEKSDFRVLGHELLGKVVEVGDRVVKVKTGDFVSAESHVVCGECLQCKNDQSNVCINEKILGISQSGVFAEYVKLPEHILWKTDVDKITPEVATMQEPFGNAVHAASKVELKNKSVAIFGLGPIGQFLVLVAKAMGAKSIIGVDVNQKALGMGLSLGLDRAVLLEDKKEVFKEYGHNPTVVKEIMGFTKGGGVDVSFEMSGFNSSLNNCLFSTRRGGDVVLFGIKSGDFIFEDYNRFICRGFSLHCVIGREIFKTWESTKMLLEDKNNLIQDKIWNVVLNEGRGTILRIEDYTKEIFLKTMMESTKILIKFSKDG